MSDYKLKDDYVARVVMLTGERNRLRSEVAECRRRLNTVSYYPVVFFALGYFLACILWGAF
jgi:hypothetical protein